MKNPIEIWDKFWFEEKASYPIAAFRITFGIYLFIFFAKFLPFVEVMFSNAGVYSPFWIGDIAPIPVLAWLIYFFTLTLIVLFILGFRTNIVTPLLLFNFLYYYFLNFAVKNSSYDRLIILFLLILSLGTINKVWSIEKKSDSKDSDDKTSIFITRVLCVQMSIFYFCTGFYKSFQPMWSNGEILRMTMASNWGTPLAFWILKQNIPMWVYDTLTYSTIFFEMFCGALLWVRPVQKYVFILAMLFHLSVWVLLSIPEFMICTTTYVLFMPPDELKAFGEIVKSKFLSVKELCTGFLPAITKG